LQLDDDDDDDDDDDVLPNVHLKLTRSQLSLQHTVPKLKPTCPRKTKTAGVHGVSPVSGKVEELWRKGSVER